MLPITANSLESLKADWLARWPAALACWSRFVQLCEPRWCLSADDERQQLLTGSFAMIRLVDHAVVISLRQIQQQKLEAFALEILAHEIGHHVYCPADLADNARMLARVRSGLPTREDLAPLIANLYTDLLINDRLQRGSSLDLAGVFRALDSHAQGRLWTLYMRIYELLWKMPRGEVAEGKIDQRLEYDAQLGARLVRSYAKQWLDGAGRFAVLCLPYVLEDGTEKPESIRAIWHDTKAAGQGGVPEGMAEINEAEQAGAIHPAEDPDLSGTGDDGLAADIQETGQTGKGEADPKQIGTKSMKQYRGPREYADVLRATGLDLEERQITARYYRERAMPHLIRFPVRQLPQATDPLPEGLEVWDVGSPLEEIDWLGSVQTSPHIIPGITTRQRLFGTSPGTTPQSLPIDLYLGVDCSGSMGDPAHHLSYPVLAGAIIALSALRAGSCVMVALSGEPGKTITTDGFMRDERSVLGILTNYLGTGTSFGIHRLDETFRAWPPTARPVHLLIISDNDIFSSLGATVHGRLGWDVAREAVARARGGGTYVLELPPYLMQSRAAQDTILVGQQRMEADGWTVNRVASMEELVEFARRFSQAKYDSGHVAQRRPTGAH